MAEAKEKKTAPKKTAPEKTAAAAEASAPGEQCCVEKCKQTVRAKGYCQKHYLGWRRGEIGKKQRYKICSKEGCRKAAELGGRCAEHKKGAAPEAAAS